MAATRAPVLVVGMWMAAMAAAHAAAPDRADTDLILDETAYWRAYLVCRPAYIAPGPLRAGAEGLLGKRLLARIKRGALDRLGKDTKEDWRNHVLFRYGRGDGRAANYFYSVLSRLRTSPPPAGWMKPDFDDGDWTRQREPYMLGRASVTWWGGATRPGIQHGCFRTTFEAPDPAGAGKLTLKLVYRGGVRVFLNGAEVARGHLPKGPLTAQDETPGEPYPVDAYVPPEGEFHVIYGRPRKGQPWLMPELHGRFDDLPKPKDPKSKFRRWAGNGNFTLTRACWDTLQKRRDRELVVDVPGKLLRAGRNVLAVEVRASQVHPITLKSAGGVFGHNKLLTIELRGGGGAVPSCLKRPPGIQVWVEDIHHRVYDREFYPPGKLPVNARIVGGRNGSYAVQIIVGTDRGLTGLRAAVGELRSARRGRAIPASASQVRYGVPHPSSTLVELGEYKSEHGRFGIWGNEAAAILDRHGRLRPGASRKAAARELAAIQFLDHLSPRPPAEIAADSCRPIWITVKVPADVPPGEYRGTITVRADGVPPVRLPLTVEVLDWRVPDPRHFVTVMALEQSPYGIARHYGVAPWTGRHFALMEKSFALLGAVSGDWLNVPILAYSEFGNGLDSPVRITRRKDGGHTFDYRILDRYLDLAVKHWGVPAVIAFTVNHPGAAGSGPRIPPLEVPVIDEATNKTVLLNVGRAMPEPERQRFWRALARSLHAHMKRRGLAKSMYWGLPWDGVADAALIARLKALTPGVPWARLSHGHLPDETFRAAGTLYGFPVGLRSRRGWSHRYIHLLYPRNQGSVITCFGNASPFTWRLMMDRALVAGARGICRVGADYWKRTWLRGWKGRLWMPGLPCNFLLWPGPDGAESSARFEILREGVQEAEARIVLEQALDKLAPGDLKKRLAEALTRHSHDTMIVTPREPYVKLAEYATGWQARSRGLYGAAADAAKVISLDVDRSALAMDVPARGTARAQVKLRNWSAAPRKWTLAADADWLAANAASGTAAPGHQALAVNVDASKLKPETEHRATLRLIDLASGRTETVQVTAKIGRVCSIRPAHAVLNVAPGGKAARTFVLHNGSGRDLTWRLAASAPWLRLGAQSGTILPGGHRDLAVEAAPPQRERARLSASLQLSEPGGVTQTVPLVVHVVPPYRAPAGRPKGVGVPLQSIPAGQFKIIRSARRQKTPYFWRPRPDRKFQIGKTKTVYPRGMREQTPFEVAYNIEGKGVTAFAVDVGFGSHACFPPDLDWSYTIKLHFEIYVDGTLRAQSGLISATDGPRLLVATGLEGAKEIRLKVRDHGDRTLRRVAFWGDPAFYGK